DGALAKELLSLDQDLPGAVTGFQKRLTDRHAAILAAAEKRAWSDLPILEGDPREKLRAHAKALGARADALESAADAEKRKALELEHEGLKAKAALKAELPRISRLLGNLKRKHSLEACKKDLKTTAISMKAKSLSEAAVTAALREALDSEFEQLGSVPIELKLADRSDKGKTKYKLQLAVAAGTKLEDVLSEGEQRSIAIGSFLAELALSGHKGGIVFDDPVSSLDHQRKHRIAARLAVEAKERQVIVFTHDLVFLTLLQAELDELGVASASHWLEKDQAGKPGQVRPNDSPANTRTYRDTKLARASIKAAEAKAGEERVKSLRQAAGQLRRTLEEIVPFYLFNDVVARWRENLMLTKLPTVRWENAVADEIGKLFGELSRHVEGHSHTEEYAGGVPELDDLKKFADRVDAVIAAVKKKRT
ncbi:MAG: AAA family ATPase, partial [Hyphomicrobium sp.]